MKAILVSSIILFLLIGPGFSRGTLHGKNMNSEVYGIDYRGPETHTYLPPPNRAGERPINHHRASMVRSKPKRSVKKIVS
ncbi:Unknown protein [Striga hermonthica]|uniref:Uncharacterized protein n=1 Tax=Striga hermonthica TaxID=68872 RepID=A0A9N7P236_STRHE|nr:Unknown protein [Striga hermonthica]